MERTKEGEYARPLGYNFHLQILNGDLGAIVTMSKIDVCEPITHCDLVANFFVARTTAVRDRLNGWDNELKVSEHVEFFLRAKQRGLRVAYAPSVSVNHGHQTSTDYRRFRERRSEFMAKWFCKHDIDRVFMHNGDAHIHVRHDTGRSSVDFQKRQFASAVHTRSHVSPLGGRSIGDGGAQRIRRPIRRVAANNVRAKRDLRATRKCITRSDRYRRFVANLQLLNDSLRMTELGEAYCVFCGLLLGWIREGRPLEHDLGDADFFVHERDWWRLMRALPQLEHVGFQRSCVWVGNNGAIAEITLKKDGAKFEFFRGEQIGDMYRHYAFSSGEQIAYQYPQIDFAMGEFLDRAWRRPANPEDHLAYFYGDWRTPKPDFHYARDVLAIVGRECWHGQSFQRWG
jgi:hypothetical protein